MAARRASPFAPPAPVTTPGAREPHGARELRSEERFARDFVEMIPRDNTNADPAFTFAELKAIRDRQHARDAERNAAAWPEVRRCATIYPAPLATPPRRAEVRRVEPTSNGVRVVVA